MTTPNAFRPARLGTSCFAGPGSTFAAGWHNLGEGNAADTAESRRVAAVPDAARLMCITTGGRARSGSSRASLLPGAEAALDAASLMHARAGGGNSSCEGLAAAGAPAGAWACAGTEWVCGSA